MDVVMGSFLSFIMLLLQLERERGERRVWTLVLKNLMSRPDEGGNRLRERDDKTVSLWL